METHIYKPDEISLAAKDIQACHLVAFPTETVYGLGADATNVEAVKKVYQAKGRPSDNPLIVHVTGMQQVQQYAEPLSPAAKKLMSTFWPGPLTIIFKLKPNVLSKAVTGGLDTAAFRNPNNQVTLDLIQTAGVPLVGPSANTSGKPSPTTAQHVYHDLKGKIAGILDDGETDYGVESTVLDMSVDQLAILRPGAITAEQIEAVIQTPVLDERKHVAAKDIPKAPGMKYKHYAPNAQVYIVDHNDDWQAASRWAAEQSSKIGVMTTTPIIKAISWSDNVETFDLGDSVRSASHSLFAGLRHFDNESEVNAILAEGFQNDGLGEAYMNRLNKSAGQIHFKK